MTHNDTKADPYKEAGVDIEAGNRFVDRIKPMVAQTSRVGAHVSLGGFGGLFDLAACGYTDPVLVAATDGVGTKLRLLTDTGRHATAGQDLVAMCVNDLVVQGAEPLFFLDYFATGKLQTDHAAEVVRGIAQACQESGCALIGGETAEMPGHYPDGDYDLAGFAVGAVERGAILPLKSSMQPGDLLIGLASSGVHSNGFSLVRKILGDSGMSLQDQAPFDAGSSLEEALLAPTKLYVQSCLKALKTGHIKGLAHITGGGLTENLPRILPDHLRTDIDLESHPAPPLFKWLAEQGQIDRTHLMRTFNCGVGMVLVVSETGSEVVINALQQAGETAMMIGQLSNREADSAQVIYHGGSSTWPS